MQLVRILILGSSQANKPLTYLQLEEIHRVLSRKDGLLTLGKGYMVSLWMLETNWRAKMITFQPYALSLRSVCNFFISIQPPNLQQQQRRQAAPSPLHMNYGQVNF